MIIRTAGREDITKEAGKVVDLMLSHHLRHNRWDGPSYCSSQRSVLIELASSSSSPPKLM